jgi:hypothetical protein
MTRETQDAIIEKSPVNGWVFVSKFKGTINSTYRHISAAGGL